MNIGIATTVAVMCYFLTIVVSLIQPRKFFTHCVFIPPLTVAPMIFFLNAAGLRVVLIISPLAILVLAIIHHALDNSRPKANKQPRDIIISWMSHGDRSLQTTAYFSMLVLFLTLIPSNWIATAMGRGNALLLKTGFFRAQILLTEGFLLFLATHSIAQRYRTWRILGLLSVSSGRICVPFLPKTSRSPIDVRRCIARISVGYRFWLLSTMLVVAVLTTSVNCLLGMTPLINDRAYQIWLERNWIKDHEIVSILDRDNTNSGQLRSDIWISFIQRVLGQTVGAKGDQYISVQTESNILGALAEWPDAADSVCALLARSPRDSIPSRAQIRRGRRQLESLSRAFSSPQLDMNTKRRLMECAMKACEELSEGICVNVDAARETEKSDQLERLMAEYRLTFHRLAMPYLQNTDSTFDQDFWASVAIEEARILNSDRSGELEGDLCQNLQVGLGLLKRSASMKDLAPSTIHRCNAILIWYPLKQLQTSCSEPVLQEVIASTRRYSGRAMAAATTREESLSVRQIMLSARSVALEYAFESCDPPEAEVIGTIVAEQKKEYKALCSAFPDMESLRYSWGQFLKRFGETVAELRLADDLLDCGCAERLGVPVWHPRIRVQARLLERDSEPTIGKSTIDSLVHAYTVMPTGGDHVDELAFLEAVSSYYTASGDYVQALRARRAILDTYSVWTKAEDWRPVEWKYYAQAVNEHLSTFRECEGVGGAKQEALLWKHVFEDGGGFICPRDRDKFHEFLSKVP